MHVFDRIKEKKTRATLAVLRYVPKGANMAIPLVNNKDPAGLLGGWGSKTVGRVEHHMFPTPHQEVANAPQKFTKESFRYAHANSNSVNHIRGEDFNFRTGHSKNSTMDDRYAANARPGEVLPDKKSERPQLSLEQYRERNYSLEKLEVGADITSGAEYSEIVSKFTECKALNLILPTGAEAQMRFAKKVNSFREFLQAPLDGEHSRNKWMSHFDEMTQELGGRSSALETPVLTFDGMDKACPELQTPLRFLKEVECIDNGFFKTRPVRVSEQWSDFKIRDFTQLYFYVVPNYLYKG